MNNEETHYFMAGALNIFDVHQYLLMLHFQRIKFSSYNFQSILYFEKPGFMPTLMFILILYTGFKN